MRSPEDRLREAELHALRGVARALWDETKKLPPEARDFRRLGATCSDEMNAALDRGDVGEATAAMERFVRGIERLRAEET